MRIIFTKIHMLLLCVFLLASSFSFIQAQTVGSFRSINSGNWYTTAIWQTYNGSAWIAAVTPPSVSAPNILVQHSVTITDSVTLSSATNLLISGSGMLEIYKTIVNRGTIQNDGIFNWYTGDIITRDSNSSGRILNRLSGIMNVQPYTSISLVNQKLTNTGFMFKFGNSVWNITELKAGNGSFDGDVSSVMIFYGNFINLNTSSTIGGSLEIYGSFNIGNINGMVFKGNMLRNSGSINSNFIKFEGGSEQKIIGTGNFQRLTINNKSGVVSQNGLNVSSEIRLILGKINLSGNQLTVGTSPNNEGILFGGSDSSYVFNGSIRRWVNSTQLQLLQFPVGTPTAFLQATVTLDSVRTSGSLTVRYFTTDPLEWGLPLIDNDNYLINSTCSTCGIWEVQPTDGLLVRTYRLALLLNNYPGINNPVNLRIIHRPVPSVPWVLRGQHNPGTGIANRFTARRDSLSAFGQFAIGGGLDNPLLPVELMNFNVFKKGNASALAWQTASERNADFFQIERSIEARSFKSIGQVKAHGNSTETHKYFFNDDKPEIGINYYRLKIMDVDGKFEYSKTVSVMHNADKSKIWVYPNPVNDRLMIERENTEGGNYDVEISDMLGRTYFSAKSITSQQYGMDMSEFTKGIYLVKMSNGRDMTVFKVVKQ